MQRLTRRAMTLASFVLVVAAALPAHADDHYPNQPGYNQPSYRPYRPGYRPNRPRYYHPYSEDYNYKDRSHVYLGVRGIGLVIAGQDTKHSDGWLGSGGGVGLTLGARLSPFFSLEAAWDTTWHGHELGGFADRGAISSLYLMSFSGAMVFHAANRSPVEPFLRLGAGYSFLGATYRHGFGDNLGTKLTDAPHILAGAGLNIWAGPFFSVDPQIAYRGYWFDHPEDAGFLGLPTDRNYVSAVSFELALTFHL